MVKNFAYDKELTLLCKAVKNVYKKVIKGASFDVANKGSKDLVTNLDIASEEFLLNVIKTNFPDDTIISEEGNPEVLPKGRTWTVDPIDGTINFANGSHLWGIQVSFSVDGVTEFAIIYMPDCRYFLYAARGFGAYCNNKRLTVEYHSDNSKITAIDFGKWVNKYYYDNIETIIENSLRVRTFGAGCFGFQRNQLKDKWQSGKITHEDYIKECKSYGEKEEGVFKTFALVGGGALATEVVVGLKTKDRER